MASDFLGTRFSITLSPGLHARYHAERMSEPTTFLFPVLLAAEKTPLGRLDARPTSHR